MAKQYETVIGLEVHVELATKTKIFCACSYRISEEHQIPIPVRSAPVCRDLFRYLNKQVVEYAMAVGLATNCEITPGTANLTAKIIFIRITHRTIRFPSCICQSARNGYVEIEDGRTEEKSPYP